MKKTLTLLFLLSAIAQTSVRADDQNLSWTQDDLSATPPFLFGTGSVTITAATDLDFSNLSTNPDFSGISSIFDMGNGFDPSSLTFTSANGQNYSFQHITAPPSSSRNMIIHAEDISFTQTGNILFAGGSDEGQRFQGIFSRDSSISFTQTKDISFSHFSSDAAGAALYAWAANNTTGVGFSNTGNISFISNTTQQWGGAIVSHNIQFNQVNGNILFEDNHANGDAGGAIASFGGSSGEVSFSNITGSITFKKNEAHVYQGGAIATGKSVSFDSIGGGIAFLNNKAQGDGGAISAYNNDTTISTSFTHIQGGIRFIENECQINGGAITTNSLFISDVEGGIDFSGNKAEGAGGAVLVKDGINISHVSGGIIFSQNESKSDGGAIFAYNNNTKITTSFTSVTGGIQFTGNESSRAGGAIATNKFVLSDITGETIFAGNNASTLGGAIYAANGVEIDHAGQVSFLNNHAGFDGGAIYLATGSTSFIRATGGNILFSGNTGTDDNGFHVANSISIYSDATLTLSAETGRSITFHDPISGGTSTLLNINGDTNESTGGDVIFSGKSATASAMPKGENESQEGYQARLKKSRHYFAQEIRQYGGTLTLEEAATLEANTFSLEHDSLLQIGKDSSVTASFFNRAPDAGISISSGSSIEVIVGDLDLSKGIDINLSSFSTAQDAATIIMGNGSLILGGKLNLADSTGTLYTATSAMAQNRTFRLIHDINGARGDTDFAELGYTIPENGYQGTWDFRWEDNELVAEWTATGGFNPWNEFLGGAVYNSLWSSATNIRSLTGLSPEQANRQRILSGKLSNYWVSGLGDFGMQRSSGQIDGYDYQGGGYALGADFTIANNHILGAAFGQISGKNKSRSYSASNDQDSLMGMIYAGGIIPFRKDGDLRYNISAAYGNTSNKITMYDSYSGRHSDGKWDNRTWQLNGRIAWDKTLNDTCTLSPFAGLEYTNASFDAFSESGPDPRHFGKGSLGNLAMPIGATLSKVLTLGNGRSWSHAITISYSPDIYRHNPKGTVSMPGVNSGWTTRGVNMGRHAGIIGYDTRYQLNANWNLYAGYNLELRKDAAFQNVKAGASYSF